MPPRPRSPRPRPTPSRRPRVAGMAPTAPRPDGTARPSGRLDDGRTELADAPAPAPDRPAEPVADAPTDTGPATDAAAIAPADTGAATDAAAPADQDGAGSAAPAEPKPRPRPEQAPAGAGEAEPGTATDTDSAPAQDRTRAGESDRTERIPVVGPEPERPAGKTRRKQAGAAARRRYADRGEAETVVHAAADVTADVTEDGSDTTGEPAAAPRTGGVPLPAALHRRAVPLLAAALVVLAAVAVVAGMQDARLRGTPAAANTALADVGATAEVAGQLSDAIETVYSFDFARLDENENAAREVITPEFATEFDRLFGEVRTRAPEQQAVVSATVTLSAVKEITGDRAVLVAFVDQLATRAAPGAESQQLSAAGRLAVTGERVDGRWKIAAVTPL
jgi:Mce-associated membrane protein